MRVRASDRGVAARRVYGDTRDLLVRDLPAWGIDVVQVDAMDLDAWRTAVASGPTRVVYVQTLANTGPRPRARGPAEGDHPRDLPGSTRGVPGLVRPADPRTAAAPRARGGPGRTRGRIPVPIPLASRGTCGRRCRGACSPPCPDRLRSGAMVSFTVAVAVATSARIDDGMIRVSWGVKPADALIADFLLALDATD